MSRACSSRTHYAALRDADLIIGALREIIERMVRATIDEIQRDPAGYLRRVEAGESILIVREDQPVAEIKPLAQIEPASPAGAELRPFGLARGEFTIPDNFDQPLPDVVLGEFEDS